jgi:surface protein
VLEQLKAVSDYQVVIDDYSDADKLREKFMEALWTAYNYETFNIRDVVDTDYFTIDDVEATLGEASVSGDIVTWNMDGIYRTGTEEELTIDITLKNQYLSGSQNVFNPNKSTNVKTSAADIPNEDVANTGSPELTLRYDVKYEANAPGSCTVSSALPATTREIVFDVVAISDNKPQCEGYHFKQWVIANDGVRRINDDYFLMPNEDVTLRAMWEKITIDKTTDGDIYGTNSATLGNGTFVNARLKALANSGSVDYDTWDRNIKAIKYATSLPADFTPSSSNTISARNSKLPIYAWFDNTDGTIYFYSPAEKIETGTDISGLAHYMEELNDISGLSVIDVSNVRQMSRVFEGCGALADLSPLADWNVSNVTNMLDMFDGYNNTTRTGSIVDVDALSDWDVSSVTDMNSLFRSQGSLSDIEGLRNWNISSVEKFDYAFYKTSSLIDLSPLSDWAQRFGSATSFNSMFDGCAASNYSPLADWDVSTVIDFSAMFEESGIVNLSSLEDWNVSSGERFAGMFEKTDVADLTGISGWNVHNAKNMNSMFEYTIITDLTKISGWDVSSVSTLGDTFAHTPLTTLDGLDAWKTKISSLTSLSGAFSYNYQLTDISDIADWPIGGVLYLNSLFEGDIKLTGTSIMALKDWDVSGISNISYMFDKCIRIDSLEALRDWDVRNVMNMRNAFSGMHALTSLEPLSGWITSSLTNMISTFSARIDDSTFRRETGYSTMDSSALTSLHGLEGWDVDGVTTMYSIFGYNNGLSDISALSGWHTDSLTTSADAFRNTSITSVEAIRGWNMSSVTNVSDMFNGDLVITSLSPLNDWTFDNSPTMLRTFNDVNASLARPYWYHE